MKDEDVGFKKIEKDVFQMYAKRDFVFQKEFEVLGEKRNVFYSVLKGDVGGRVDDPRRVSCSWISRESSAKNSTINNSFVKHSSVKNSFIFESFCECPIIQDSTVERSFADAILIKDARLSSSLCLNASVIEKGVDFCVVGKKQSVRFEKIFKVDLRKDLSASLRTQLNTDFVNDSVLLFKRIKNDRNSFHDPNFFYPKKGWVKAVDPDLDVEESCSSGLHFSDPMFWKEQEGRTISAVIKKEDIICVMDGKVRCKKAFILPSFDIPEPPKRIRNRKPISAMAETCDMATVGLVVGVPPSWSTPRATPKSSKR